MAKNNRISPVRQIIESVIMDGEMELDRTRSEETLRTDEEGAMTTHKVAENHVLADDTVLSLGLALRQDGAALMRCAECRQPTSHREQPSSGIVLKENARRCDKCARVLCPRHARRGSDGLFRCPRCHSRSRLVGWLRSIFFERVED